MTLGDSSRQKPFAFHRCLRGYSGFLTANLKRTCGLCWSRLFQVDQRNVGKPLRSCSSSRVLRRGQLALKFRSRLHCRAFPFSFCSCLSSPKNKWFTTDCMTRRNAVPLHCAHKNRFPREVVHQLSRSCRREHQ